MHVRGYWLRQNTGCWCISTSLPYTLRPCLTILLVYFADLALAGVRLS
jgi:hypothetical protein